MYSALLVLCLIATCHSASFISENGILAEEEGTNNAAELGVDYTALNTADNLLFYKPNLKVPNESSSEESDETHKIKNFSQSSESDESKDSSSEENKRRMKKSLNSKSSESDESKDSSSEENVGRLRRSLDSKSSESNESKDSSSEEKTLRRKRSLDSKQDSPNTIGKADQTIKPEGGSSGSTKDLDETNQENYPEVIGDVTAPGETTTLNSRQEAKEESSENETTTQSTTVANPESTTEADAETTTEAEEERATEANEPSTERVTESTTTENTNTEDTEETTESSSTTETTPDTAEEREAKTMKDRVDKLSDQIRLVLKHYQNSSKVVLPGQDFFPDPMPLQDFNQSISVGALQFTTMRVFGLSNFTVEHINTDVDRMQVYILLHMKKLVILGNYSLKTFWNRAKGPFNVTLLDVDSEGVAEVATADEGHLEATDSSMDMFTKDMRVDFKNLGFLGSIFQGAVGAIGDAIFNSLKPQILDRVNRVIRTDVNKKLKEFSVKFINKVAPVDRAFSEGRKYARSQGYDPYHSKDHSFLVGGIVTVNISEFVVEGLSRFYRVGNLSLSMDDGVIEIGVHVSTGKLTGSCNWAGETFGLVKSGKTNFTVDHLQVRALVNQSLDIRKKPQLKDLDMELGWVKVTMDSSLRLNKMIESIINATPRLIRHIIVDTLEEPLKEKVQEILDKINVESIVEENLPRLDSLGL